MLEHDANVKVILDLEEKLEKFNDEESVKFETRVAEKVKAAKEEKGPSKSSMKKYVQKIRSSKLKMKTILGITTL